MQKNNYLGVGIMPKKTKFNRFFEAYRIINEGSEFRGLCFFRRWLNQDRRIYANKKEQYKIAPCGNNPIKAILFGPMAIGAVLSFLTLISILSLPFYDEGENFQWWIPLVTFCWNLFFLNLLPITARYIPDKMMYLDRQNQTVGFTFDIPGCEQRDDLGNSCFKWEEIVCRLTSKMGAPGVMNYFPEISHIDQEKYPKTTVTGSVVELSANPVHCYLLWECYVRFMDLSKPLPDVPVYERHRHLDPITAEFDKRNNRPDEFWSSFSFSQQLEIEEEILSEAFPFDWLKGREQEEIIKPWQHWKAEPERIEQLTWKYKAKHLALQLFIGFP
ncbi:hypothetical protein [Pseudoalteromonas sp. SG44-8]|uniref:hypothetical protein n=1 Tax=Pseudoalteromonas sp. SG44-8 TaxID=2760958 RepID=UPI0015FEDBE6|nr:hypothetical protein [Pseudoalteromonas sp. SG44-8]MBB1396102.1 hypothetical protein [Pseudoalteromonas sp. SG44-8]